MFEGLLDKNGHNFPWNLRPIAPKRELQNLRKAGHIGRPIPHNNRDREFNREWLLQVSSLLYRFFWNIAFNHTGYRSVMLFNLVLQILVFASIRFTVFTPALYLI